MKNEFRKLLLEIASKGCPTTEEVQLVLDYLNIISGDEWRQAFRQYVSSPEAYVASVALLFTFVLTRVQQQQRKDEEEEEKYINDMDVTFIAHGNIVSPKLPCSLYYVRSPELTLSPAVPTLKSITLYEPWGCAIDASVVYGIASGLININAVRYSDVVLPSLPHCFNKLPNNDTLIPMPVFTPVTTNEKVYAELMELDGIINMKSRGLVIPYFQSPFDTGLPEIPLWALTNVLDVISYITGISFNLHVAACLTVKDTNDTSLTWEHPELGKRVVNCDQYYTVPVTPTTTMMTCNLTIPQRLRGLLATLDNVL